MTAIVKRFNFVRYGRNPQHNAREAEANTLKRELEDMQEDAERLCREARDRVEQERRRDQER